jgi:hypothetical protein
MPSKLKKLVRERMAKTGERFATALAHVRARRATHTADHREPLSAAANGTYAPELIVTRYFGQQVTFAIAPVHGRCMSSPSRRSTGAA